jgi:inorganic pyrophosphatase
MLIERLRHYFATYKMIPARSRAWLTVDHTYDREHALRVVEAAMQDYFVEYGD